MVQGPVGYGEIWGLCSECKHTRVFPALPFPLPGTLLLVCPWQERGFPRLRGHPPLTFIVLVLIPLQSELSCQNCLSGSKPTACHSIRMFTPRGHEFLPVRI